MSYHTHTKVTGFFSISNYNGARLIWSPRGHAKVSVLTGVRIKRDNFGQNKEVKNRVYGKREIRV